ncbi:hypothetical protein HUJ04_000768 [Dendroctonus ponderosae]|nr:hypothetical protein HUJ04_000768 [Dendroctonus ponderosae]KAH1018688.1 hypothetical protein HUJ05_006412 [Dendroctonus ponderosae]
MPGINIFREHRNELRPHQDELMELTYLAGIHMNKDVFRCLVDLLNMGVSPNAIFKLLKNLKRKLDPNKSKKSHRSQRSCGAKQK